MRLSIVLFFFGIVSTLFLSRLPNTVEIFGFFGCIIICFFAFFFTKNAFFRFLLKCTIIVSIGFLWVVFRSYLVISQSIPPYFFDRNLWVQGQIISLPKKGSYVDSFLFCIKRIRNYPNFYKNPIVELYIKNKKNSLKVGDEWQLSIKLHRVHSLSNPGGFDLERSFFEKRIQATGIVQTSKLNHLLRSSFYSYSFDRLRQSIQNRLRIILKDYPLAGIIIAIVMGDTADMHPDQWEVFRRTGTNHLVAISGLHIALVAGFLYAAVNVLWRRIPYLCLQLPAPYAAFIEAMLGATLYSALAGFSVSTQRAVIMMMVVMGFGLLKRNTLPWYSFLVALLLVLLLDPLVILLASFWLSFCAVAIIFYGLGGRVGRPRGLWWRLGRVQWVVTLCMLPLNLLIFQQVSLVSFLANSVAIPWVECIVVPLSLGGTLLAWMHLKIGNDLVILAEHAMGFIWQFLHYLSSLNNVNWRHVMPEFWIFGVSFIGFLLLMAPRGLPGRYLGLIGLLPLLCNQPAKPKWGNVWFTLLDVGQGLSAVVQTNKHTLVFDAGLKRNEIVDMGQRVVLPFLYTQGTYHMDALVISHGDNDHSGGAEALAKAIKVDKLFTSVLKKFDSIEVFKPISLATCYQGQRWQWDGVYFEFLNPPKISYINSVYAQKIENNHSCVLRITVGEKSILIPGDIEKPAEYYLIRSVPNLLQADILVVPHHGSRSSSSPLFIDLVKPQYALFSLGYHNRYHFPHPWVVGRYRETGARMLDTANQGAITFKLEADSPMDPISDRLVHQHFWNFSLF